MEHTSKVPDRNLYSRVFVIMWTWSVMVLAESYAGTLTAMITRPGLVRTIRNAEDLLNQGGIQSLCHLLVVGDRLQGEVPQIVTGNKSICMTRADQ